MLLELSVCTLDPVRPATVEPDARLAFIAGACPLDEDGVTVGRGDHAAQAARCIENMTIALAEAGATVMEVISTCVLVASTDRADLLECCPRCVRRA
ncbi:Rid family hydrolase [Arthrobacter pityocampae]|uniref:Rid family hydrolase n=1 Tax=Arthrobacter pityocampae TaxID=547334 RepID=UPI002795E515|nr:Rid family hydrolase [Arthrobacter pityocampae]